MIARLLLPLLLLATPAPDMAGTWALEAEGHPVMLLVLAHDGGGWRGRLRALHWQGDEVSATIRPGPASDEPLRVVSATPSAVGLAFGDGGAFTLRSLSPDIAEWRFDGGGGFVFRRVPAATVLAADLDPARAYVMDAPWPTNPAMTRLYEADQADRKAARIDWSVVSPADARRRGETQALLDADALHSGNDFWHAAFIFQHGSTPSDYLKAHALAVIAAARGRRDATWIAAATLDRYLQKIGHKQVYGTQFQTAPGVPTTQEPYDRTVLSDGLRRATDVPTLAEQEGQRAESDRAAKP